MNALRVLHVIPALGPRHGGPSAAVLEMTQALRHAGVECEIACTRYNAGDRYESPWPGGEPAWVHLFDSGRLACFAYSRALDRWLKREVTRFDVVHIHSLFRYTTVAAARRATEAGVPYVIRPAGALDDWGMGRKWIRKSIYVALIERRLLLQAAAFHCTSRTEADSQALRALRRPSFVIPHGVSLRPALHPGSSTGQTVLFLSRLDPKKNVELMLLALADIAARHPNLQCIIAGAGTRVYEARLRRMVERPALKDRVRFAGFVSGDAKQALFDCCDIFVLPSEDENFGLAAAEAMAAGMAVVLTRGVALSEAVADAQAGLVIEKSRNALAAALSILLDDPELVRQYGRNARRLMIEQFAWHVVTRKLIEMYGQVVEGQRREPLAASRLELSAKRSIIRS